MLQRIKHLFGQEWLTLTTLRDNLWIDDIVLLYHIIAILYSVWCLALLCFYLFWPCLVVCKIEILWSKGINKLPLLFPLPVKGCSLCKLNTFRQASYLQRSNQFSTSIPRRCWFLIYLVHILMLRKWSRKDKSACWEVQTRCRNKIC